MTIKINTSMERYMHDLMNKKGKSDKVVDTQFNNERLQFANKSVKNGNFYVIDKYNLIIRKNEFNNKKSAYGWIYDENKEPINIHIDSILLKTQSDDITTITLQQLKREYPTLFKSPRGMLFKIYSTIDLGIDVSKL